LALFLEINKKSPPKWLTQAREKGKCWMALAVQQQAVDVYIGVCANFQG
jgi:hypothetical protein